jgi:5-methyltetrahydropteroyltriglutamate--homocysteine methyltransferase
MSIPTEPIGSIPRPLELIEGMPGAAAGRVTGDELDALFEQALKQTIGELEATGSPFITDGSSSSPASSRTRSTGSRL